MLFKHFSFAKISSVLKGLTLSSSPPTLPRHDQYPLLAGWPFFNSLKHWHELDLEILALRHQVDEAFGEEQENPRAGTCGHIPMVWEQNPSADKQRESKES